MNNGIPFIMVKA